MRFLKEQLNHFPGKFKASIENAFTLTKLNNYLKPLESVLGDAEYSIAIIEPTPLEQPGRRILYINRSFSKMTGYSANELVNLKTLNVLKGPLTSADELKNVRMSLDRLNPVKIELINYRKDGAMFWIESSFVPFFDNNGLLIYWISISKDITEQKLSEEKMQRSHQIQRVINSILEISLESLPFDLQLNRILKMMLDIPWLSLESKGCIFIVEENSNVLAIRAHHELSQSLLSVCGKIYIGKCLCGKAAQTKEIIFADHIDENHEINYKGMEPHGHYCVPITSGQKVWGVICLYVKKGHKKETEEEEFLTAVASTLAGFIERKHIEEALRKNEEQFRSVIETANDAIILLNEKWEIVSWNRAAQTIFQYSPEEVMGKEISTLIPERFHDLHKEGINRFIREEKVGFTGNTLEIISKRSNGSEFPAEISFSMWSTENKKFYTAIIRDITKRKETEQALFQSEKLASIGQLAAGVAHEINNPLANASLSVQRLLKKKFREIIDNETIFGILDSIKADIDRVSNIAKELLYFSRKRETLFELMNINEVIQKTLIFTGYIKKGAITLELQEVPVILGDPIKLQQVLLNILNNSYESLTDYGEITLSTSVNTGSVVVEISDNGCGISEEHLTRVFDPFFTTKEVGEGTGLGLSISYGIIKQHKGIISIMSTQGKGTTVTIKLPVD